MVEDDLLLVAGGGSAAAGATAVPLLPPRNGTGTGSDKFEKNCPTCLEVFSIKAEYCKHLTMHGLRTTKKKKDKRPLKSKGDTLKEEDESKYYTTQYVQKNDLMTKLQSDGVAVLSKVIPDEKIDGVVTKMWDTLLFLTSEWDVPLDIHDENTYRSFFQLHPHNSMLCVS